MTFFLFLCAVPRQSVAQFVRQEIYHTERARRMHYAFDDWISYPTARLISSVTIGTNYIYFGTLDGGILRYQLYENSWDYPFTTSNGLPSNTVRDVVYDTNTAILWAITDRDTAIFDPAKQEWISKLESGVWTYRFPRIPKPGTDTSIERNIFYDQRFLNLLPVFFANGNFTLTGDFELQDFLFRAFPIIGFLKDQWDRIWFLVEGFGIGIGDLFSQRADFYEFGLSDILPQALAFQGDDLWIGGFYRGTGRPGIVLWRAQDGNWEYYEARWIHRLPDDNVAAIAVDGDSVWFGTQYGVSLLDRRRNRWRNFNLAHDLISNQVQDLAIMSDYLYVATDLGINRIHLKTGVVKGFRDRRIMPLSFNRLAVQKDTLWAATEFGLYRYIANRNKWEYVPTRGLVADSVFTAVANYRQEMWFATSKGILWLELRSAEWHSFPQIGLEIHGPFRDIQVNDKSVWVATQDGLLKYDKIRKYWRIFTTEDGLLDNHCNRILLDGDFLWVATDAGITQFYWNNPARID